MEQTNYVAGPCQGAQAALVIEFQRHCQGVPGTGFSKYVQPCQNSQNTSTTKILCFFPLKPVETCLHVDLGVSSQNLKSLMKYLHIDFSPPECHLLQFQISLPLGWHLSSSGSGTHYQQSNSQGHGTRHRKGSDGLSVPLVQQRLSPPLLTF